MNKKHDVSLQNMTLLSKAVPPTRLTHNGCPCDTQCDNGNDFHIQKCILNPDTVTPAIYVNSVKVDNSSTYNLSEILYAKNSVCQSYDNMCA